MLSCHVCPLVHGLIVFVWRVCKDETKINSAGWIPVTRDISAYFLMQFWNSVFFCSLLVTAVWKSFNMLSCHVLSSCSLVDCFCVKSLQGWDKDKFSGLNSSDERHLRLLSDAVLEQRFLLQLACDCGLKVFQMLSCHVCLSLFIGWLFLCEECARMRQR